MCSRSRNAFAPELCKQTALQNRRGRRRPGADRTHGPRATRKHAAEPQVRAEHPAFPARRRYGLYVISPGTGCLAPVARALVDSRELGISTGMPGTHDFAVRECIVRPSAVSSRRHAHVHRISGPTLVTIAKRPSWKAETRGNVNLICPTVQVLLCDTSARQAVKPISRY